MGTTAASLEGRLVLFEGPDKKFRLTRQNVPALTDGEVLVRNLYTTICGSDLHTYCGLRHEACPTVLGHEIVGEIIDIDPGHCGQDLKGNTLSKGDRITWSVFASDVDSLNALAGIPQKGENLFKYGHALATNADVFHGGLAEYCVLRPGTAILRVPADMPLAVAATINCSIATVAGAVRLAGLVKDKDILITGMGHLGITCAAMCRDAGARWIGAADIADKRLAEAMQFGATTIFNLHTDNEKVKDAAKKLPRKGIDIVFDMSGSSAAMQLGLDVLAVGGTAIWVGAVFNTPDLAINPERIIRNLTTIRGLHNYNFSDFEYALDFMERNWSKFPFLQAVEKEFTLDKTQEAFDYAVAHKPLRVGIRI